MTEQAANIARTRGWAAILAFCAGAAAAGAVDAAVVPAQQTAIVQIGHGGPEVLQRRTIPVLEPGADQVLIRVYAAAVNPLDWKLRIGIAPVTPGPETSGERVPGRDVAGVVAKLGPGVTGLRVGQAVFAMLSRGGGTDGLNGAYAEYAIAPAANVVPKPGKLTYAQAAGIGVAGATAARSIDAAGIGHGQRVLITGVAGGVGSSAAQIAIARGARVIGTATPRHAAFLKSIGVTDVIDYRQGDWIERVRGADVVIDTVGAGTALAAFNALRKGGTFVSVASRDITPDKCAAADVRCPAAGPPGPAGGPSEGELLRQVAALAEQGRFRVHIDKSFPLEQAAEAQECNRAGHTEGKVVLIVTEQARRR